jgi:hypothetical protein
MVAHQANTGPQDGMLLDSSKSFFKPQNYVRHTNYNRNHITEIEPKNAQGGYFGSNLQFQLDRAGDLLGQLDLQVDLTVKHAPSDETKMRHLVDGFGYAMIEHVTFKVGTNIIQTIPGEWLYMHNALTKESYSKQRHDDFVLLDHDSVTHSEPNYSEYVGAVVATVDSGLLQKTVTFASAVAGHS